MCLAVPGRVVDIRRDMAEVDIEGNRVWAWTALIPDVQVGEYVLVHAGCILNRVDERAALETLRLLEEVARGVGFFPVGRPGDGAPGEDKEGSR